jgi:hypothetical protein
LNASISAFAIIPIIGESGKVAKYTVKYGDEAVGLIKNGEKVDDVTDATKIIKESELPPACFVAGTTIKSSEGNVNIENIEVGDLVWSFNETSSLKELKEVEELFVTDEAKTLIKLTVAGEIIYTTPEHPFYVNGKWIHARYLSIGNPVTIFDSERAISSSSFNQDVIYNITNKEVIDTIATVYNFRVGDNHDYYVTDLGILVHNNPCAKSPKTKTPTTKSSPYGPKIADEIPKNGVPKNWSKNDISDAMDQYKTSINSRKKELKDFLESGKGTETGHKLHAKRITEEENFVKSLEKAYDSR